MVETSKADLIVLGMATLTISLLCQIALTTYFNTGDNNYYLKDTQYQESYLTQFKSNTPTNSICAKGDDTCTNDIINVQTQDTSQYDIIPSLFNIGKLAKNIAEFMFMLPLFPLVLTQLLTTPNGTHEALIENAWLVGILTVITGMWTFVNVAAIIRFIFRK